MICAYCHQELRVETNWGRLILYMVGCSFGFTVAMLLTVNIPSFLQVVVLLVAGVVMLWVSVVGALDIEK
ncbi:MAG: hypothetical protein ACK59Y_08800, partial [Betaproteobacteria bacterium]